ncbi:hypothetical protein E2C01_010753 [Portunus trituberculatus]|uniref:Uncharacterized protein n=1 Tax=Portunus trituberculatus TaxID=210409 RepID=A0A5B7D9P9_PORTR|nr:hypothetical protein [Portunus trituberculatus]
MYDITPETQHIRTEVWRVSQCLGVGRPNQGEGCRVRQKRNGARDAAGTGNIMSNRDTQTHGVTLGADNTTTGVSPQHCSGDLVRQGQGTSRAKGKGGTPGHAYNPSNEIGSTLDFTKKTRLSAATRHASLPSDLQQAPGPCQRLTMYTSQPSHTYVLHRLDPYSEMLCSLTTTIFPDQRDD